jgi:hypothetical protein
MIPARKKRRRKEERNNVLALATDHAMRLSSRPLYRSVSFLPFPPAVPGGGQGGVGGGQGRWRRGFGCGCCRRWLLRLRGAPLRWHRSVVGCCSSLVSVKYHSSELCGDYILWSILIHWSNYIEKPAKIIRVTKVFRSPEID